MVRPIARGVVAAAMLAGGATAGTAQTFPIGAGPYDPAVPTVAGIRGPATGEAFSTASDVVRVLERIARGIELEVDDVIRAGADRLGARELHQVCDRAHHRLRLLVAQPAADHGE